MGFRQRVGTGKVRLVLRCEHLQNMLGREDLRTFLEHASHSNWLRPGPHQAEPDLSHPRVGSASEGLVQSAPGMAP